MKNKKLGLLLLSTLVLVGCGNKSKTATWSNEIKENMTTFLGEVLPDIDAPKDSIWVDNSDEENQALDIILDSSENYITSYVEALKKSGYELVYENREEEGFIVNGDTVTEETATCYYYQLQKTSKVIIATYSEHDLAALSDFGTYYVLASKGNEIYAYDIAKTGELTSWPEDEVKEIFGTDIPHMEGITYDVMDLTDYGMGYYIVVYSNKDNLDVTYKAILEENGWSVIEGDYGYEATKEDSLLAIGFSYESYSLTISINQETIATEEEWPSEKIATNFNGAVVPSFPGVETYYVDDSDLESYGLVVEFDLDDVTNAKATYEAALTAAEFTMGIETGVFEEGVDSEIWSDKDKKVKLIFDFSEEWCGIQIFAYWDAEEGGEDTPAAENEILLTNESQLVTKDANESVWQNGDYKLVVSKGSSLQNVGNDSYFSNPLRFYAGQVATISWGANEVTTIELSCVVQGKAKMENASVTGGSVSITGETMTITINEGAEEVVLNMNGQFRINSITFNK